MFDDLREDSVAFGINLLSGGFLEFFCALFFVEVVDDRRQDAANFVAEGAQMHQAVDIQIGRLQFGYFADQLLDLAFPVIEFSFVLQEGLGVSDDQQLQRLQIGRGQGFSCLQFWQQGGEVDMGLNGLTRLTFEFFDLVGQSAVVVAGFSLGTAGGQFECLLNGCA